MEKIKLVLDKDLMDIIPDYISHRKEDCSRIMKLFEEKNFEEISKIGHKMAGSGGGYGFDEISRIGKELEIKSKNEPETIPALVERLDAYLDNIEITYE